MNNLAVANIDSMTSLEIAELTSKNHRDVLRDVRKMLEDLNQDASPILDVAQRTSALAAISSTYTDAQNQERTLYRLDKELTLTLTSGYSVKQRHIIIKRWLELEESLAPTNYIEALKELIVKEELRLQLVEQNKQLEQKIEDDYPKVHFAETVAANDKSLAIGAFAKTLSQYYGIKVGPNKLFEFLRISSYLMRGRSPQEKNQPYQKWVDKNWFEYKYVAIKNGPSVCETKITGLGQLELTEKILQHFM